MLNISMSVLLSYHINGTLPIFLYPLSLFPLCDIFSSVDYFLMQMMLLVYKFNLIKIIELHLIYTKIYLFCQFPLSS